MFKFRFSLVDIRHLRRILKAGSIAIINMASMVLLTLVFNRILLTLSMPEASLAAYSIIMTASNICYAFSSVLLKRYSVKSDTVMISGYQFIFGGFVFVIGYSIAGLLWCITIVGIPFGKQCFNDAKMFNITFFFVFVYFCYYCFSLFCFIYNWTK